MAVNGGKKMRKALAEKEVMKGKGKGKKVEMSEKSMTSKKKKSY